MTFSTVEKGSIPNQGQASQSWAIREPFLLPQQSHPAVGMMSQQRTALVPSKPSHDGGDAHFLWDLLLTSELWAPQCKPSCL